MLIILKVNQPSCSIRAGTCQHGTIYMPDSMLMQTFACIVLQVQDNDGEAGISTKTVVTTVLQPVGGHKDQHKVQCPQRNKQDFKLKMQIAN